MSFGERCVGFGKNGCIIVLYNPVEMQMAQDLLKGGICFRPAKFRKVCLQVFSVVALQAASNTQICPKIPRTAHHVACTY